MGQSNENSQQQYLELEKQWHEARFYVDSGHWTSHPLLASRERHWLHNDVQSLRFYGELHKYVKNKNYRNSASILLAPVGNGRDAYYLRGESYEIHGIDISALALASCPKSMTTREANILHSGYEDQSFDIIVCSQFLHHVHAGFDPFIKEFYRLLRKGGTLAILEPSRLYPFGWITSLARKLMGNVTGLVENERPLQPHLLTTNLKTVGFENIRIRGLLFSHVRFPSPIQHILDALDYPFRVIAPFRSFANSVAWYCSKP